MHVVHTGRKRILGIDVIACADAEVVGEGEVLSLRKLDAQRFLRVNEPRVSSLLEKWHDLPIAVHKVPADSEIKGIVVSFRSSGDERNRAAKGEIHVASENPSPADIGDMPSQRGNNRHERIFQRSHIVAVAHRKVVNKRNVDRMPAYIEAELSAIPVVNIKVAVGPVVVPCDEN